MLESLTFPQVQEPGAQVQLLHEQEVLPQPLILRFDGECL